MPELPSMIDGFPLEAGDPDFAIQLLIDKDLENAQTVRKAKPRSPAGLSGQPFDPGLLDEIVESGDDRKLYPNLFAARPRSNWLMPAVRRLAWNRAQGDAGKRWLSDLTQLISWSLEGVKRVRDTEYLALAEQCEVLAAQLPLDWRPMLTKYARALEARGPLSEEVVKAQRRLQRLRVRQSDDPEATVWTRFRSGAPFIQHSDCWDARVRAGLEALEPKLRATWLRAFDASPEGEPTRKCLTAVEQLGKQQLEDGLQRWAGMLAGEPGPALSPIGSAICQHVVMLCGLLGGDAADRLLYRIASARWTRQQDVDWMHAYLRVIGRRPDDRAFACLEALAMNPVMATGEVRRQYEALLSVFGARSQPAGRTGIDGFPLDQDPALAAQQTRIDQFLRMGATAAARGPYVHPTVGFIVETAKSAGDTPKGRLLKLWANQLTAPTPWFDGGPEVSAALEAMQDSISKEFAFDPAGLHQALAIRMDWIKAHEQEFSDDTLKVWRVAIQGLGCGGGLLGRSLKQVDSLPLERLLTAIQANPGRMKVFDLSQQYVAEHGWNVELVAALERWVSAIPNSASANTDRAKVTWFLWFEDVAPIRLDACWSHRVKQDLRAMEPEERAGWIALLENHTFVIADRPPMKWFPPAEAAFRKLGAAAFRKRFVAWFAPFAKPEPLNLTITGRTVLRTLMWYALIAKDPRVDRALADFAKAKWRTKEIEKRTAQAEMAFSYVLAERAPEAALPILRGFVKSGRAYQDSKTEQTYQELLKRRTVK